MYRKSATTNLFLTPSYQAPEVEFENADKNNPQPRSRRYDIWSLGCVFLEFSIWLLHGPKAIEGFARTRGRYGTSSTNSSVPLYEVTDEAAKVAIVHQLVSWTIERLQNDTRCKGDTALAALLSLIKDQMLQPKVEDRAWAEGVSKQLEEIVRKAENHESYLFHSCNRLSIPFLNFDEFRLAVN
ncbi:Protein kinase domain-containing protein [Fusarium sp. LHS14.1]|nr:Protein kinase domain-containing protein [Fusarium sp. LHS14.1]